MTVRDLLSFQITYLTYVLDQHPGGVEAEIFRPTYLSLKQIRESDLTEAAFDSIRQLISRMEWWLSGRLPVGRRTAEGILIALRQIMPQAPPPQAAW